MAAAHRPDPRLAGVDPVLVAMRDAKLARSSRRQYLSMILLLQRLTRKSVFALIRDADATIEVITTKYQFNNTCKSMVTAVKAALKHAPGLRERVPQASVDAWNAAFKGMRQTMVNASLSGDKTDKEKEVWVDWHEVVAARERVAREAPYSRKHLVMCLYSLIPPLRHDFWDVRIFQRDADVPLNYPRNYLVLESRLFVMAVYKTARAFGVYRRVWPAELMRVIRETLRIRPRTYLFEKVPGVPFRNSSEFADKISNRTFREVFSKNCTVNILRHSFISGLDFNKKRPYELADIASAMAHGIDQQNSYRKFD